MTKRDKVKPQNTKYLRFCPESCRYCHIIFILLPLRQKGFINHGLHFCVQYSDAFLAPTGAQGVTLSVCPTQKALTEHLKSTQRAREQSDLVIASELKMLRLDMVGERTDI